MKVKRYHQRSFIRANWSDVAEWFEQHQEFIMITVVERKDEYGNHGFCVYFYTESEG
jgi:hypothetical protein